MKKKPYEAIKGVWYCGICPLQRVHRNEIKCKLKMNTLEPDEDGNIKATCKGE